MKKKIVAMLACLALVLGVFAGNVQETKAEPDFSEMAVFDESNMQIVIDKYTFGPETTEQYEYLFEYYGEDYANEVFGIGKTIEEVIKSYFGMGMTPGNVLKAGDVVSTSMYEYAYFVFGDKPLDVQKSGICTVKADVFGTAFMNVVYDYLYNSEEQRTFEIGYYNDSIVVPEIDGVKAWKIASIYLAAGEPMFYLMPVNDYALVTNGNTTQWIDYKGNVVWSITEEEDKVSANLSDWAAINADTVASWNEKGKAIDITYKYNGYTVTISLPAGEALADTGAEWYGPEYLAAVNQKYVVVKDATGLVVPNDRIYKK